MEQTMPEFREGAAGGRRPVSPDDLNVMACKEVSRRPIGDRIEPFGRFGTSPQISRAMPGMPVAAYPRAPIAQDPDTTGPVVGCVVPAGNPAPVRKTSRALTAMEGDRNGQRRAVPGGHGGHSEAPSVPGDVAAARRDAHVVDARPVVRLISCVGVDRDLPLLGHFIDHYVALGIPVDRFHIVLNAAEKGSPGLARARSVLAERGIVGGQDWIGPYTSGDMWERRRALQIAVASHGDWIVSADTDEFHAYPAPLPEVIAECARMGVACVQGPFVDRIAADGALAAVDPDVSPWTTFPVAADIGVGIGKVPGANDATGTVKVMLHRGDVLPALGGHNPQPIPAELMLYGAPLSRLPDIKTASFRFSLPFRVWHFKWTAGLKELLELRRNAPNASKAGSVYGSRILDYLDRNDGRIDLGDVVVETGTDASGTVAWRDRVREVAALGARTAAARNAAGKTGGIAARLRRLPATAVGALRRKLRGRGLRRRLASVVQVAPKAKALRRRVLGPGKPRAERGWRVRQLTTAGDAGSFHSHSYYDIPVLDAGEARVAAHRMSFQGRWMTPDDSVDVGIVDVANGGFTPVGTSRAWSWQQGPMAQWLIAHDRSDLVWNDRRPGDAEGDDFVARIHDVAAGTTRTIPRPIYALDPAGTAALSLNMARLDKVRPGYGYIGGRGARLDVGAPRDDGIWRIDMAAGAAEGSERLIVSLHDAVAFLAGRLPAEERADHLSGGLIHWFNHAKFSPDGRRFTVKLRWRAADLKSAWTGRMGVSLTCAADGSDLRLLARATSHVIWLDDRTLCLWNQGRGAFSIVRDDAPEGTPQPDPYPGLIGANVHFRPVPGSDRIAVYDTPYAPEVDVMRLERTTGAVERLARFANHVPHHGPFRCDLHPIPFRGGDRFLVTSLQDGGRQLHVVERDTPRTGAG